MNNLTKNNSQTIPHNTTIKQPVFVDENVSLTLPEELRSNDVTHNLSVMEPKATEPPITILPKAEPPKYGCLKNGSLPTFRSWRNQTQRQYPSLPSDLWYYLPLRLYQRNLICNNAKETI